MTRERLRPGAALTAICLGFFVIQLDATIVNVALPAIGRDVGGSLGGLQWVIDSYTVAFASVMLTAGSFADRFGARRVYLTGLAIFAAGSAACAAAPGLAALIAARAVQGLGASALLPASLALITHVFPSGRARARALGAWGGIAGVGLAAGPVLGGAIVATTGWRVIFLVNVPVCMLTTVLIRSAVREPPRAAARYTDVAGLVLGVLALAALTGGFIEAGQQGWSAPLPLGLLGSGAVAGAAFVRAEQRQSAPMLPLGLFRSGAYAGATGTGFLFNLCLYGALICLSLYLQQARGETPLAAGAMLLPATIVIGGGATASGPLTARFGPRVPMVAGMALAAVGSLLLSLAGPSSPLALVLAGSMVLGLCSLTMPAMTAVAVGAVGAERSGLASGVLNAARQSGGALGVAVLGSLLTAGGTGSGHGGNGAGHGLAMHAPLLVAAGGYLVAVVLSWLATRPAPPSGARARPLEAEPARFSGPSGVGAGDDLCPAPGGGPAALPVPAGRPSARPAAGTRTAADAPPGPVPDPAPPPAPPVPRPEPGPAPGPEPEPSMAGRNAGRSSNG